MDSKYLIQNQQRILNNDEEDVFSIGNEEDNGDLKCMKKLVHLDCENSLSVSSDINDVSEIKHFNKKSEYPDKMITPTNNNAFSYKNNNLRKSEEIIKYISDTSGNFFNDFKKCLSKIIYILITKIGKMKDLQKTFM